MNLYYSKILHALFVHRLPSVELWRGTLVAWESCLSFTYNKSNLLGLTPSPSNIYPHLGIRKVPFCRFHQLDILILYAVHEFVKGKFGYASRRDYLRSLLANRAKDLIWIGKNKQDPCRRSREDFSEQDILHQEIMGKYSAAGILF